MKQNYWRYLNQFEVFKSQIEQQGLVDFTKMYNV